MKVRLKRYQVEDLLNINGSSQKVIAKKVKNMNFECVFDFISKIINNPIFTGFLGVFIGAILDYFVQKKLNKKQNKFSIENKILEGLMERNNNLALIVSENNFPYVNNSVSNEFRTYIKISQIEIDDKIHILDTLKLNSELNNKIIKNMNNLILYFKLNLIPIYRFSNYKRKLEELYCNYTKEYNEYCELIYKKINGISHENIEISEDYVKNIYKYENNLGNIKSQMLHYLTNLNITIQNELYKGLYKSKIKIIENSNYIQIELVEDIPKIIDINE